MPGPLLLADTPWLLYRSFFALPKSIVDGDGSPVNALLGTVNAILALIEPPTRAARAALAEAGISGRHARSSPAPAPRRPRTA